MGILYNSSRLTQKNILKSFFHIKRCKEQDPGVGFDSRTIIFSGKLKNCRIFTSFHWTLGEMRKIIFLIFFITRIVFSEQFYVGNYVKDIFFVIFSIFIRVETKKTSVFCVFFHLSLQFLAGIFFKWFFWGLHWLKSK